MVLIVGMTIWILALLLLAAGAAMGHRQGAIRVAVSFIGIIFSALLAWPLSGIVRAVLPHVGFHNPLTIWLLPPLLTFLILLSIFKSFGLLIHHKADVFYKYKAFEIQRLMWERLNKRVGLSLGLLNGLAYFVLVSFVIFDISYWTVQVAPSDDEKWEVRLFNRMGHDLEDTRVSRIARAVNPLPKTYFKTADLAGLVYQNPRLLDRLSAYPAFLSLSERDDFKQLGQDADFQSSWKSRSPIGKLLNNPLVQSILQTENTGGAIENMNEFENYLQNGSTAKKYNPGKLLGLVSVVLTNLDDLQGYLQTGQSEKFSREKILGRWDFNVMASLTAMVQSRANVPSSEMAATRALWSPAYAKTEFVAGSDGQAFLKNLPHFKTQPDKPTTFDTAIWQGQWKGDGDNYDLSLTSNGENKTATAALGMDDSRLTLKTDSDIWIFDRE
jgi:hypothetical protein